MRAALLYNPRLLLERLAVESTRRRRLARIKRTPASQLSPGHIDSLELLDLANQLGIDVIYDIGANIGTWTLLAKAVIPGAEIHAFEPLLSHQEGFVQNTRGIEDIVLHGIALGSANREESLHVTDFSDASSILPLTQKSEEHFGLKEVRNIKVQTKKLDEYRMVRDFPLPDLMKLDVQGYELQILNGGRECLKSSKAVILEVSFIEFYKNQCLFEEVVEFMKDAGFGVLAFGINTPLGRELFQTDVLFSRRIG